MGNLFPSEKQTKERATLIPCPAPLAAGPFIFCCSFCPVSFNSLLKFILTVLLANNYPRKKEKKMGEGKTALHYFVVFQESSALKGCDLRGATEYYFTNSFMNEFIPLLCLLLCLCCDGLFPLTSENAICLVILVKRII